ncbi:MAG: DinB family protein [bacterium]
MQVADLVHLYDYNYWANGKLRAALVPLSTEQFVAPVAGSYGSIRNTLVHTVSAEWGWLDRCGGPARGAALKAEDYPTLQALGDRWEVVEGHMRTFLAGLSDADLARRITFALPGGPPQDMALGDLLHHGAVHGVHHRAQVALLMRELGFAPGNFDLLIYLGSEGAR